MTAVSATETKTAVDPVGLLARWTSQNGRWGLKIFGPASLAPHFAEPSHPHFDVTLKGYIALYKGEKDGYKLVEIVAREAGDEGRVCIERNTAEGANECAEVVVSMGLQSEGRISVVNARPGARWTCYGYKGRRSFARHVENATETAEREAFEAAKAAAIEAAKQARWAIERAAAEAAAATRLAYEADAVEASGW